MGKTVFIVEEIEKVVAKTNTALTAAGFTSTVYYDYGHIKEITQRLQELTDSPNHSHEKFPLIILLTDVPIQRNIPGFYGSAKMRFLICNITQPEYTSKQRTATNFKPVLHPIKEAFIEALTQHGQFVFESIPMFTETDCYYYGSQINDKNVFNDHIDAIELDGLSVNVTEFIC
jgi:hypothetical protein